MNRPVTLARREALRQRVANLIEATPGCTGNQLQAGIGGNRAILLQAVNDLMAAGHVTRHRDPADRRICRYTLTRDYVPAAAHVGVPAAPPRRETCVLCGDPLPPRKHRYCSDLCRIRQQRKERVTENSHYGEWLVRSIRKMGTRASNDLDALTWLSGAVDHARDALAMAVAGCRATGYSDAEIGQALGITRQAVGQRFGRKQVVYTGKAEPA